MDPDGEFWLSFLDVVENMQLTVIYKIALTQSTFFGICGCFNIALESTGSEIRHISMSTT